MIIININHFVGIVEYSDILQCIRDLYFALVRHLAYYRAVDASQEYDD